MREPLRFRKLPVAGGADLYYIEDEELDCLEVVNAPLPPIPQPMTYTSACGQPAAAAARLRRWLTARTWHTGGSFRTA